MESVFAALFARIELIVCVDRPSTMFCVNFTVTTPRGFLSWNAILSMSIGSVLGMFSEGIPVFMYGLSLSASWRRHESRLVPLFTQLPRKLLSSTCPLTRRIDEATKAKERRFMMTTTRLFFLATPTLTRLCDRRRWTEPLAAVSWEQPPAATAQLYSPVLPAEHKAFFCKFPQVVKKATATIPPFVSLKFSPRRHLRIFLSTWLEDRDGSVDLAWSSVLKREIASRIGRRTRFV